MAAVRTAWVALGVFWVLMLAFMFSLAGSPIHPLPSDGTERARIETMESLEEGPH